MGEKGSLKGERGDGGERESKSWVVGRLSTEGGRAKSIFSKEPEFPTL